MGWLTPVNDAKKEHVATTVRLPKEAHRFVELLAAELSLTKQEAMLALIEEGIAVAKDELSKRSTNGQHMDK